ncbi:hypothetical protein HY639_04500 [Candidatus Woesearchaeota archaeon]|nr:hypothetical protein [Candidatus Woesearchaeota archaeon]
MKRIVTLFIVLLLVGCLPSKETPLPKTAAPEMPVREPEVKQPVEVSSKETSAPKEAVDGSVPAEPAEVIPVVSPEVKIRAPHLYKGRIDSVIRTTATGEYTGTIIEPDRFARHAFRSKQSVVRGQEVTFELDDDGTLHILFPEKAEESIAIEEQLSLGRVVSLRSSYKGDLIDLGKSLRRGDRIPFMSPIPLTTAHNVYFRMEGGIAVVVKRA